MNIIRLVGTLLLLTSLGARAVEKEDLYGTWRLVSYEQQNPTTGAKVQHALGKAPRGFLNYGRDGRMYAIIVGSERPKPGDLATRTDGERVDLFNTLIAYSGTFAFDGKTVTHHVDISWNETWTGTAQLRHVTLEGTKLTITTNPQPSGISGQLGIFVLVWEKLK